eukprot:184920-Chlamydomonas_euryale.AAC.1
MTARAAHHAPAAGMTVRAAHHAPAAGMHLRAPTLRSSNIEGKFCVLKAMPFHRARIPGPQSWGAVDVLLEGSRA